MPLGDSTQEHEGQVAPQLNDLPWNTHSKLRKHFGYPTDSEFFGEWLLWFYDRLSQHQRRILRKTDLSEINPSDFPAIPSHH